MDQWIDGLMKGTALQHSYIPMLQYSNIPLLPLRRLLPELAQPALEHPAGGGEGDDADDEQGPEALEDVGGGHVF